MKNSPTKTHVALLPTIVMITAALAHGQAAKTATEIQASLTEEETIVLSPFEVTGGNTGYAAKNTMTATGFNRDLQKTPLMINVLTDDFLRDAGLTSYEDVADFLPNTYVVPDTYNLGTTSSARGHSTSYYAQDGSRFYTDPILRTGTRVEVIKGPATLFFGRSQPGGVFNFATPLPSQRRETVLAVSYGSYDKIAADLSAQGKIDRKGHLTYRLDTTWQESSSFIDNGRDDIKMARGSIGYSPVSWLKGRFVYEKSYRKQAGLTNTPIVMSQEYYSDYRAPRQRQIDWARTQTGNANRTTEQLVAYLQGRWRESDTNWANDTRRSFNLEYNPVRRVGMDPSLTPYGWDFDASGANSYAIKEVTQWGPTVQIVPNRHVAMKFSYIDYYLYRPRQSAVFTELWGDGVFRTSTLQNRLETNDSYTMSGSVLFNYNIGKTSHTTNLGAERFRDLYTNRNGVYHPLNQAPGVAKDPRRSGSGVTTAGYNPWTDPYPDLSRFVITDGRVSQNLFPADNFEEALFGSHIVECLNGRLGFLAGGRVQSFKNKTTAYKLTVDPRDVYTLGVSWEVKSDIVLFASSSTSFEPNTQFMVEGAGATLQERTDNPSPFRQGKGFDVGLKWGMLERKLTGSVSWFETDRMNDFRQVDTDRTNADSRNQDTDQNNNVVWYEYGGRRVSSGLDLEMIWQPTKSYSAVVTWGWLNKAMITENLSIPMVTLASGATMLDPEAANAPGLRSPNAPRNKLSVWNRYVVQGGLVRGLGLGVGVSHTSAVTLGNQRTDIRMAPAYTLVRLSADYPLKVFDRTLTASVVASNVFDKRFYRGSFRGEPRAVTLKLRYSL